MADSIPDHGDWKKLKKKYGVKDGAAKGVDMGKALDTYYKGLMGMKPDEKLQRLEALEPTLLKYFKNFDDDKADDPDGFRKAFQDQFLASCQVIRQELSMMNGSQEGYVLAIQKLSVAAMNLSLDASTKQDLERFNTRHLRRLGTLGGKVQGLDTTDIQRLLDACQDSIEKHAGISQPVRDKLVKLLQKSVAQLAKICRDQGLKI
jgi:hypothetical protein